MIEAFGVILGTPFQGITLLGMFALALVWWIRGAPDRRRAENETKIIDNAEAALRYKDFRDEVHELKNELMKVSAKQAETDKLLIEADAVNRQNRDEMSTMMFVIELLISELENIDPNSVIVKQAKRMMKQVETGRGDPRKSEALNTAEHAVRDAKQTVRSASATCEEVKTSESKQGGGGK